MFRFPGSKFLFSNFCDERERELVFPPVFIRLKSFRLKYFSSFREEREREQGRDGRERALLFPAASDSTDIDSQQS